MSHALLWLALASASTGVTTPSGQHYSLQPPGTMHGNETLAQHGESWFALQQQGDAARLVTTRLRVEPVNDPIVDDEAGRSARDITSEVADAVFYLRGPALRAGAVPLAHVEHHDADGLIHKQISLAGHDYSIATTCVKTSGEAGLFSCSFALLFRDQRQHLFALDAHHGVLEGTSAATDFAFVSDTTPTLLFAGDLDRDGKLDLIIDTRDHYNVSRPTLFLSSAALPGELLHAVAEHRATGC